MPRAAEAALPSFAELQRALPHRSPRAWRFAALRAASRAGALVSDGRRTGYRHGFDSGPFMDHVYAAAPSGRTRLGRAIDRRLLSRRTCVAFRDIRVLAEQAVRDALAGIRPSPDVVFELGLYGIEHDDAKIERHFADLAELVAPDQIVFNVQTANPEIEYIARVWVNAAGGRCVWRLRPVEQILGYAQAAGYEPASIDSDRFGIYRVVRLEREPEAA